MTPIVMSVAATLMMFANPHSSAQERLVWVGVSDTDVSADHTLFGMNLECKAAFAKSRMCTTEEVMYTQLLPPGLPEGITHAWVRPIWAGAGPHAESGDLQLVDQYAGDVTPSTTGTSCRMWTRTEDDRDAMVVVIEEIEASPVGYHVAILRRNCANEARVACCAPK